MSTGNNFALLSIPQYIYEVISGNDVCCMIFTGESDDETWRNVKIQRRTCPKLARLRMNLSGTM